MATDLLTEEEREVERDSVKMPDRYEIIDGQIVEMPEMSVLSVETANLLNESLVVYLRQNRIGRSRIEMMFPLTLSNGSIRSRRPDVSYVSFERWPQNRAMPAQGNDWEVLPELVVEVVSPNDLHDEIEEKISEYFQAGISQVWIVDPIRQMVATFESVTKVRRLLRDEIIEGIPFLPGFTLRLSEIFPVTVNSDS